MGVKIVRKIDSIEERKRYNEHLLADIRALEQMCLQGLIEEDNIRIGAEQELCLVDRNWYPAPKAMELLQAANNERFTTEITRYNLEINLDPLLLGGDCFKTLFKQLRTDLHYLEELGREQDVKIVLTGILPTIEQQHLREEFMAPVERYYALNNLMRELRGREFDLHMKGIDEVTLKHDSVLFEGCNTSFQAHLQVGAKDFVNSYNWAQMIAGPVLSICTNSPLLLGKELWDETRIALFTQSIDTRASSFLLNEREARVSFGDSWALGNAADLFRQEVLRFRSLLTSDFELYSDDMLLEGQIPKLKALGLHNGTIYRWNRACYGVTDGKPHLRIENRYIPSGPTVLDQVANMAFWVGLMRGRPATYDDLHLKFDFKDVKNNFLLAARYGMSSRFYWGDKLVSADRLLKEVLLPIAWRGLLDSGVSADDANHYLKVIENRIDHQDASRWIRKSFRNLRTQMKKTDACRAITAAIYTYQRRGVPVSAWKILREDVDIKLESQKCVKQFMNRNVVTARIDDNAGFIDQLMEWRKIHHMPVIDNQGILKGILTSTDLDRHRESLKGVCVEEVMNPNVVTITPDQSVLEARELLSKMKIGSLPVVHENYLVGIITKNDV
ncbi:CBS domain-containing protein [Robertkochia marina]|uniref:CBS domain-containing protein n=1 Tax=Robertkochia marina TaxID=1227945 RepID=A0A4V3UXX5_9FLAO|nr:CBS domain-containing protein [Robertkochia marina]THD66364.1 CBS domain-containing protein [Robertkochia marina]TRZ44044.1 CBS domain-containing protein [Robertkochia marina]